MATVNIQKVVNILINDVTLLQNISSLARRIVSPACFTQLEPRWTMGTITTDRLLNELFEDWVKSTGKLATIEALCEILQDMKLIFLKELLEEVFRSKMTAQIIPGVAHANPRNKGASKESRSTRKKFSNAGSTYKSFTGRTEDLLILHNRFEDRKKDKLVLVSGLGGVGKTELVRTFCNQVFKKYETSSCIWLSADSAESLLSNLREIVNSKSEEAVDLFKELLEQVEDKKCCLVVFDNVDVRNEKVENILQKFLDLSSIFFLVTSRDVLMLGQFDPYPLELKVLSIEDAQAFIRETVGFTGSEDELEDVKTFCESVQCYTLALRQAVSYITEQRKVGIKGKRYSVSHYLKDISSVQDRASLYCKSDFDYRYHSSVLKTLIVTVRHLESLEHGDKAVKCLRLISCMRPDDTTLSQLQAFVSYSLGIPESEGVQITKIGVQLLKQFSLIECEDETVTIHRVVQEVIILNFFAEILKDFGPILSDERITGTSIFIPQLRNVCESIIRMVEYPDLEQEFIKFFTVHYNVIIVHGAAQWKEYLKVLKMFKRHFGSYANSSVAYGFKNWLWNVDTGTAKKMFQDLWSDFFPMGETAYSQGLESDGSKSLFWLFEACFNLIVKLCKGGNEDSAAALWLERGYQLCRTYPMYDFDLRNKDQTIFHYVMTLLNAKAYEKALKVVTKEKTLLKEYPVFWATLLLKTGSRCPTVNEDPKVKSIFDVLNPNEAFRNAIIKIIDSELENCIIPFINEFNITLNEVRQDLKKLITIDEELVLKLTKLAESLRARIPQGSENEVEGKFEKLYNSRYVNSPEDKFFEVYDLLKYLKRLHAPQISI